MRKEERERPVRKEHVREEGEECEGGGRGALGRKEGGGRGMLGRRERHVREEGEAC